MNMTSMINLFKAEFRILPYSVAASMEWELENGYLIETSREIKLVTISQPEFDEKFNLESLFPQNISESSEVLVVNKSLLKLKSETDGMVHSCDKAPLNS
jgi:hypothetical protein